MYVDEPLVPPVFDKAPTPFSTLLREAFVDQLEVLPVGCAIRDAIDVNQSAFSDVVEVVTRDGGRCDLIGRLRPTHPVGRPHKRVQFDGRFWNVWTEVMAFAWAVKVAMLGAPAFTDDNGKPDLYVGDTWIEAKEVEESKEDREATARQANSIERGVFLYRMKIGQGTLNPRFLKKFVDKQNDATVKFGQVGAERCITFFTYGTDFLADQDRARGCVQKRAQSESRRSNTRIVLVEGLAWEAPLLDTGWPAGGS